MNVAPPLRTVSTIALLVLALAPALGSAGEPLREIHFGDALVLARAARGGRSAVPIDPISASIAAGSWRTPKAGDAVTLPGGASLTWERLTPGKDGGLQHRALVGGMAYFAIESDQERVMMLNAAGHAMVWADGVPRTGDPYSHGYVHIPVLLKKGSNEFLFSVGRGQLSAKLTAPKSEIFLDLADATLPDLLTGNDYDGWGAVLATNTTTTWQPGLSVVATIPGAPAIRTELAALPPLSVNKVPFRLLGRADTPVDKLAVRVELVRGAGDKDVVLDRNELALRVLKPGQTHKRTYRSQIDGSVQYYALVPAAPGKETPGLTLTLHGAGVEGLGQAACFAPKTWTHVLAATNRRPFGFDWEDWGRLDALEALDDAMRHLKPDPRRVWLTGHSMGGHGTWHLGVTFPDKFAAIGPSAGWVSMFSYAGMRKLENPDAIAELFLRASSPSDTLALIKNLSAIGVYVLHGDRDDNVPVGQARTMRKALADFHADWVYYERPGAGHWWGNECVDWPEMFAFFNKRSRPERGHVHRVEFTTAGPGVSSACHWAAIEAQQKAFLPSSIQLSHDPQKRSFAGTTKNVARLALDVAHLAAGKPVQVELDGQKLADVAWPTAGTTVWLRRDGERWSVAGKPPASVKGPHRTGPFRDAFRNRVLFVVGTKGSAEENAWALHKARFDAETFWYRGNGFIEIVTDSEFDPAKSRDRNVVLYGNADSNSAWKPLLGSGPVQVKSGGVIVDGRETKGDGLACLFVRPRPGSDTALVGAVSGTGLRGMRQTGPLPYFVSGVGMPDFILLGPDALTKGLAGVQAAGFFGNDWSVANGDFAWR